MKVLYEKLNRNPLTTAPSGFRKKVRNIAKDKKDTELLDKFIIINPNPPYVSSLPKGHKQNIPLRPIISRTGSYSRRLSKWVASLLRLLLGRFSSHVKQFQDFIHKRKDCNFRNVKMLSLDVISLFTNVPVCLENRL